MSEISTLNLPDGTPIPRLGQGTWKMAELRTQRTAEIETLRWGIENGMTLIDTAEMYADGRAEALVGEAIRGVDRDKLFLVSKVYPWNAAEKKIHRACDLTLQRMGVDYLDLYLLHWRGEIGLEESVAGLQDLVKQGKIRRWGVSNFDLRDMNELMTLPGGDQCAVNQLMYHLSSRGVEYELLPWLREHNIPMMAYCPLAQGGALRRSMMHNPVLLQVAEHHGITPVQVLLAYVLSVPGVMAIPKAGTVEHAKANRAAADVVLTAEELAMLDQAFPAPDHPTPLDIL